MDRTTDLENQDIYQPLWLIDFMVETFPEMTNYSSNDRLTEDEGSNPEELLYGTVIMELLRHGTAELISRALTFIRSIDHVVRMDLPSEHILAIRHLVSSWIDLL